MSMTMHQDIKFIASGLTLLVFLTCDVVNAKTREHENYVPVQENLDNGDTLSLPTPEKILFNHKTSAFYAQNETWFKSTCLRDLLIVGKAIVHRELWALTMLDASSKLQSGLLQGNIIDLGQYDECIAVHSNLSGNDISGRHCMYSITSTQGNVTIPINPTLSICLPATCTSGDIISFFNTTTSWIDKLKDFKIKIASATCSPVDSLVLDREFIVCLVILAIFVTFLVACTVIEMSHKSLAADHNKHRFVKSLALFSLRKSAESILNMDIKEGTLPALNGIRVLSTASIVFCHEHIMPLAGAISNPRDFLKWVHSWNSLHVFLALFAVDTFFVMSGFLMTYLFLKKMPKKTKFNVPMYYLHRYVRLTPAVIALLVFVVVIAPKFGSGAQWDATSSIFLNSCRTKWWSYFLYLQNFVEGDNLCLGHLWHLAVDMQLFWISPLILYPLYRKPNLGFIILATLFFASLAYSATVIGMKKLPVASYTHVTSMSVAMEIFSDIYINTFHRAGAWLVGVFLGYEVAMHNRQLNKSTMVAGWVIAIASFTFCIFGTRSFMDPDYEYNAVWETIFSAINRPIWAVGICWIIYISINNRAGLLSSILSSRVFLPLNKLSYSIYLIHIVFQTAHAGSLRTPMYFLVYDIWRSFFSTLIISIGIAFLFNLLFESPILVLEKMLLGRKRESYL